MSYFQVGTGRATCCECYKRISKGELDIVFNFYHGERHTHWRCLVIKARKFIDSTPLNNSTALHTAVVQIHGEKYV
jgi:hypothetical protein